ncbi:hypothetical protein DPMN_141607 [Dreissena polymorpha]|uniref:Uncharacterized protein n=1 Tax=Dreissena polymorpha TaxID=45954 RepID=A0A9D4JHU9_DREPO|nr:hypothetical protein DPMN_141607 [Dreissena polymorpha]
MRYRVTIGDDQHICYIRCICETASGELLIGDRKNNNVQLLNQTYKMVAYCYLPIRPSAMCSIDSSLVAVSNECTNELHFIRVNNGNSLIKDRIMKLQHKCWGITHHQGNLYITDGIALYHYTVDGRLLSTIYQDTSDKWTGKNYN